MKSTFANLASSLAVTSLAALGGGFAVFAGYDDAPGGVLLGLVLVVTSAILNVKRGSGKTRT